MRFKLLAISVLILGFLIVNRYQSSSPVLASPTRPAKASRSESSKPNPNPKITYNVSSFRFRLTSFDDVANGQFSVRDNCGSAEYKIRGTDVAIMYKGSESYVQKQGEPWVEFDVAEVENEIPVVTGYESFVREIALPDENIAFPSSGVPARYMQERVMLELDSSGRVTRVEFDDTSAIEFSNFNEKVDCSVPQDAIPAAEVVPHL